MSNDQDGVYKLYFKFILCYQFGVLWANQEEKERIRDNQQIRLNKTNS